MTDYRPSGAIGVLLTPFDEKGSVCWSELEKEITFLLSTGIDGLFPCATTGEFIHLSPEENLRILETTAKLARGKKQLLAGACSSNMDTSALYMKRAAELGYDAAVLCAPYYITMSQTDLLEYFRRLARKAILPVVLYNIPMFTGEIGMEIFKELLEEENIIGIKDSSANMKRISHLIDIATRRRPDFAILSGTDDCLVPALTAGCRGSMTAFSTILPEINAEIYRLFRAGDIQNAQRLNSSYLQLIRLADSITFPAGYKLIAQIRGLDMGHKQIVHQYGTPAYVALIEDICRELIALYGKNFRVK